jgi:hypothetical protein
MTPAEKDLVRALADALDTMIEALRATAQDMVNVVERLQSGATLHADELRMRRANAQEQLSTVRSEVHKVADLRRVLGVARPSESSTS